MTSIWPGEWTRLVDERLPVAGYRQWVFSFPWRIRVALAKDSALLSRVLRVCTWAVGLANGEFLRAGWASAASKRPVRSP